MRYWKILTLAAVLAVASTGGLQAQAPDARIEAALSQAAEAGVPVGLLESKIAEGRAKGVPMARIAAAVEQRLAALQQALSLMEPEATEEGVSDGDLSLGADALLAGVDGPAIATVAQSAPRERLGVAVAVLTELVQMGASSQTALNQVLAALERGPAELVGLPAQARGQGNAFGRDGQAGRPASVPTPGEQKVEPPGKSGDPPGRRGNN
ncbi:MAG TPA: hypothetical protein VK837_08365 [Longimicrobiales bacterium]|nr:hypothetical protein [Longimicrobiales bacterium]